MVTRGDIFYIAGPETHTGCEQKGARPGIIVSNNTGNRHSEVAEVVYMTGKRKKALPTHVKITSAQYESIALCEQITTVSKHRMEKYIGHVSGKEQEQIDQALKISLGLMEVTK